MDILHVDREAAAEEKLKQKLHQFDIDYRVCPGTIVFITGGYFDEQGKEKGSRVL